MCGLSGDIADKSELVFCSAGIANQELVAINRAIVFRATGNSEYTRRVRFDEITTTLGVVEPDSKEPAIYAC